MRQPERDNDGRPIVSRRGAEVSVRDIVYFMLTANELTYEAKSRPGNPKYQIFIPDSAEQRSSNTTSELDRQTIVICGLWSEDSKNNLGKFIDRLVTIRDEFNS